MTGRLRRTRGRVRASLACGALALGLVLAAGPLRAQAPAAPVAPNSECWKCHLEIEGDSGPAHGFGEGIHAQEGFTCSDCHGGNPKATDMDAAHDKTWRGAPRPSEVPSLCGRCHSNAAFMRNYNPRLPVDQEDKYATSVHGQRLAKGDENVAVCTSCHGVHGILPVTLPRSPVYATNIPSTCNHCHGDAALMAPYGIPTNQYEQYRKSVHGVALLVNGDLGAPACNDCHGNHGAAPPGVESLAHVCGTCHALNADLFEKSPHAAVFEASDIPQCEACHGNHAVAAVSDSMLNPQSGVCTQCHSAGDAGLEAATQMLAIIDTLRTSYDDATALLDQASHKGMEVGESIFNLKSARQALIETRTSTHADSVAKVRETAAKGLDITRKAKEAGLQALAAHKFRQRGLGVATLALSLFAVVLYFKIRQMESRDR
jgi:hypothetical protein